MNQDSTLDETSRLLLRCLRGDLDAADLPGPGEEAAWERLAAQARRLDLAPWLYWLLRDRGDVLPPDVARKLRKAYWTTVGNNVRLMGELQRVVDALGAAAVPILLLKGAALLETTYPSLGGRSMVDLDLLVPAAALDKAAAALEGLGYATEAVDGLGHTGQFLRRFGGELDFHSPNVRSICVELHWRLIHYEGLRDLLAIDYEGLWQRARHVSHVEGMVRELSVEDNLLYLALHLAVHHRLADIRLFLDLDRAVRAQAVDWATLMTRARAWRCRCLVYVVLALCRELLATPVPGDVLGALRPSRLRLACLRRLVTADGIARGTVAIGSKSELVLQLLLVDRARDALRLLFRAAWPETEWIVLRYRLQNRWQVPWCRIQHVVRMARYGLLSFQELAGSIGGEEMPQ